MRADKRCRTCRDYGAKHCDACRDDVLRRPLTNAYITDEMVERAARAIHDHACGCDHNPWPVTANYAEMARAAVAAAFTTRQKR